MILVKKDNSLYVNGLKLCDCMDPGILPVGVYTLVINMSPRFKCELPLIYNDDYPASRGFRIHSGNSMKDTKGCILVGKKSGNKLVNSRNTLDVIIEVIRSNDIREMVIL